MSNMVSITGDFLRHATRPLIVILGPTASGKTAASIKLAQEIGNIEIINADSRQLYKGLSIGTAKITTEEMQGIPHHLIDVLAPSEEITAAEYQKRATQVIDDIHKRGKIPMLVGGSMLYISAIIDGLDFPPAADPTKRKELDAQYDADGGVTLHARLSELDPEAANAIPRQNKPYVIRALEQFDATGQSVRSQTESVPYVLLIFGIENSREALMERINIRTKKLFDLGWVHEVRSLLDAGFNESAPAIKSHGYKEIMSWLRAGEKAEELPDLIETISAKTRQYSKRQMTWWRGDSRIQWITPHDSSFPAASRF